MPDLRQEMREMFERRNAMEFNERNSGFEDGLLEKIINLTFANLCPYSGKRWQITALRTPLMLQKLYRLLNDKRIPVSSVVLLVADPCPSLRTGGTEGAVDLLLMSLAYASKYYCIETFIAGNFCNDALAREFALERNGRIEAVVGLGAYRGAAVSGSAHARYVYSDIVREL